MQRLLRWLLLPAAVLLLAACSRQDLYSQLNERQANEVVAALHDAGLGAHKSASRDGKSYSVSTGPRDFSRAVEVLQARGLPRQAFDSLGDVFKKEGFVSSPLEERARFIHALSQELSSTLTSIDGVVQARVHVSVPERQPLATQSTPATASVFIKHRAGEDLSQQVGKIKALVVNAMEDLPYDNVTVALFPAEPAPPAASRPTGVVAGLDGSKLVLATGGVAIVALIAALLLWWRQRQPWRRGPAQRTASRIADAEHAGTADSHPVLRAVGDSRAGSGG